MNNSIAKHLKITIIFVVNVNVKNISGWGLIKPRFLQKNLVNI